MKGFLTLLLVLLASFPASAKDEFKTFDLQLLFVNGTKDTGNSDLERDRIIPWIEEAQRQYAVDPKLKISYTIERRTKAGGRDLAELHFEGRTEYNKFMDEHFDNYARSETEGHLTFLVGDRLCWKNLSGKEQCWGGYANFPHDVNPFDRKKGIWLKATADKYVLTHELGHFFSLKHTFEPYVGFNKQCNKDFANKNVFNPDLGHCNSCKGKIVPNGDSFVCQDGVSNVMDYCSSVVADSGGNYTVAGSETLNVCQQERAANQRSQYMTKDGKVNYVALAGLRGEGACESDSECEDGEYCTAGVLDLTRNVCQAKKALGSTCTNKRQCASDRCNLGMCAAADECQSDSECAAGNYCGDPVAGQRKCKAKLADGALCTKSEQCEAGRCKTGFCSAAASASMGQSCRFDDECREGTCNAPIGGATKGTCVCNSDSDCGSGKWCDKGLDLKVNACRAKLDKGDKCGTAGSVGNDHKCKSGECSGFPKYECK
jgi:hypothetical protein